MRSLGFRTHVLYALAASAGIILSLGRPWYAPAPAAPRATDAAIGEMPDTISQFFSGLGRSITSGGGPAGSVQLHTAALFLIALAAILAACALGSLVPGLQRAAASGAQLSSLLALATVVFEVVEQPGGRAAVEARVGGWIALASAVLGFVAAMQLYSAPRRRRAPKENRRFQPAAVAPPPVASAPARPVWDDSEVPVY
jgi:hypothetical protein